MKRFLSLGFAFALFSSAFAACTMDFDQFQPSGVGGTGAGGTGGTTCAGECCTSLDCPVLTDPCLQATCVANVCGEQPRADGMEVDQQTPGDCKKNVCQGGDVASVEDSTDTVGDANDCTTEVCNGSTPESNPTASGSPCTSPMGKVCDGTGICVGCLSDTDCGTDAPACDTTTKLCVPVTCTDMNRNGDETDVDCGGPVCSPCKDGDDCEDDEDCASGVCGGNDKCSAPTCSDNVKNGDEGDVDCGAQCPAQCDPDAGCNVDADCKGDACSGVNGTCIPNCQDGVETTDESDVDCGGSCDDCAVGDDCEGTDENCQSGICGAGDQCEAKPTGAMCGADSDCVSNACRDGVCCNNGCPGVCKSCALAGSVGTCTNIAVGMDPANECNGGTPVCDGNGACKKDKGAGCGADSECANGECTDGFCCENACGGTCQACSNAKTGQPNGTCADVTASTDPDNECGGALDCDGAGACEPKQANGTACLGGGECTSNNCVDTVCCDTACGGLCKSCNVAGSVGTCSDVPTGTDPANECNGANGNCAAGGVCGP